MIDVQALKGAALEDRLADVADIRIRVFRRFPYLYDGNPAYERRYLATYRDAPGAILVGAFSDGKLVGASTGTPLGEHDPAFSAPLKQAGYDVDDVFYCAESVLLPECRRQGVGHRFFDIREAHARELGHAYAAFCGVVRPENHPDRPADYWPLDSFWRRRGYAPVEGARAQFDWKEVGQSEESSHELQFWIRKL